MRLPHLLLGLTVLGFALQLEYGAKCNSYIRVIDFILNVLVIIWACLATIRRETHAPILIIWAYRSILNILPLVAVMSRVLMSTRSIQSVRSVYGLARTFYAVDRISPRFRKRPVVYFANHALWSLDDIVALAAVVDESLMVLVNMNASGLNRMPRGCREYVCTIDREEGVAGSGYAVVKDVMRTEVLQGGKSLLIFCEDMKIKKDVNTLAPLRLGSIGIAHELNIPCIPVWIHWPCQFPTIINSTEKIIRLREGPILNPPMFNSSMEFKQEISRQLNILKP